MPILNPVITRKPLIDALDIVDNIDKYIIANEDTITTVYPLIIGSMDVIMYVSDYLIITSGTYSPLSISSKTFEIYDVFPIYYSSITIG